MVWACAYYVRSQLLFIHVFSNPHHLHSSLVNNLASNSSSSASLLRFFFFSISPSLSFYFDTHQFIAIMVAHKYALILGIILYYCGTVTQFP